MAHELESPQIIAFLTDFGTRDYFVGAMKGVILTVNRRARIVDITHEIEPQNVRAASFTLRACYRDFPKKTIFVAVVDPGVGSARSALLVAADDYFFIAPDNGLLGFVFESAAAFRVFQITEEKFAAGNVSATFHGRDVFAPAAAHLAAGARPEEFGAETADFVRPESSAPVILSPARLEAEIIHVDRFGNLITNLTPADLPAGFVLLIGEQTVAERRRYYAEAGGAGPFMIFGSAGLLEVVRFGGSAAATLGAKAGQKIIAAKL